MKKTISIIILLSLMLCLFAANPINDKKTVEQKITGYIDDVTYLNVSAFYFDALNGGKGINLDYTDEKNNVNRFLIAPTEDRLTSPGLQIGTLDFSATFTAMQSNGARLLISHDKLINADDMTAQIDWEFGIKCSISTGNSTIDVPAKMCLSRNSSLAYSSSQKEIQIDIPTSNGVASIQDAALFFRLTSGSMVSVPGQYYSTVTFNLEVL